jgi:hypothetical protein
MSYFIKQLKDSGFIQHLRSQMKPEDLEKFDQMAKDKMKEYDEIWFKLEPIITTMNKGATDARSNEPESEKESGFNEKPDNRKS